MPLQFQIAQAPFRLGLAEGVDPHQAPFGTLMKAENACWTKTGQLAKRLGTQALTTSIIGGGSLSGATRLITRGSELALTDGSQIYSYTANGWADRGQIPEAGLTWSTSVDTLMGVKAADVTYTSGYTVTAWVAGSPNDAQNGGDVYIQATDANGAVVIPPTQIFTATVDASQVRALSSGNTIVIVWASNGGLYTNVFDVTAAFTGGTQTRLKTDVANPTISKYTFNAFDARELGSNFVVAYAVAGGGVNLATYSFASTPVVQATGTVTGETSIGVASVSVDGAIGAELYIAYITEDTNTVSYALANPSTLAQTVAPTALISTGLAAGTVGIVHLPTGGALLAFSYRGTSTAKEGSFVSTQITTSGFASVFHTSAALALLSRPFVMGARVYAFVCNDTNSSAAKSGVLDYESDSFLVDVTTADGNAITHREVGHVDVLTSGVWFYGRTSNVVAIGATSAIAALPSGDGGVSSRQSVKQVSVTTGASAPVDMWRPLNVGPETYLPAGVLAAYDGAAALPYGFPYPAPVDEALTVPTTTGGALAAGNYIYNTVPERRSAAGVFHRGPTGLPQTITVGGSGAGKVTLAVVPVHLAVGAESEQIAVYRTVVNGTIPQRLTFEPTANVIANTSSSFAPFTMIDVQGDSAIGSTGAGFRALATRPAIYTQGGDLDDTQPPACLTGTFYQNRLWLVGGDGYTVWISKDRTTDPEFAPGFHPDLTLLFEDQLTALASLDSQLIAFAHDRIWIVYGTGPAPNGQGGTYDVEPLPSDIGCINPRSVVVAPNGIMFQSARGIYLLTRKLELQWAGAPVSDQLALYPTMTSAVLVASRNEVRFTVTGPQGDEGSGASEALVYNYVEDQWTTSIYTANGVYGWTIADACMWRGVYTFVTTNGIVCTETTTDNLDTDASAVAHWVPLTLVTSWYNAAGPLAYQSVRNMSLEGVSLSDHALTVSCGFDNDPSFAQTVTFAAGSEVTAVGPIESCDVSIGPLRKCQSIRFQIADSAPATITGSGAGPLLDMIGVEVGVKSGFRAKPAVRTG